MLMWLSAPLKVSVDVTSRCNLHCLHCRNSTSNYQDTQLDSETLTAIIDDVAAMQVFRFTISGGEPLLRDDLPEIIKYAVDRGIPRVFLSTNGTLLTQQWLDRLKTIRGRLTLKISLDGPAQVHDQIRGTSGTADAAERAIKLGTANGFDVQVTTTLMKANVDSLQETLKLVDRLPCSKHYVVEAIPQGAANLSTILSPSQRLAASNILAAQQTSKIIARIGFAQGYPGFECCAGIRECGILSDGRIVGCRLLPEIHEGHVQDRPLSKAWKSPHAFTYYRKEVTSRLGENCKTCPELSTCRGGCRAFASRRPGEEEGPDLRCAQAHGLIEQPTYDATNASTEE